MNQHEQNQEGIKAVGNYAHYLLQMGEQYAKFGIGDVIQLVQLALQAGELEVALQSASKREEEITADWHENVQELRKSAESANAAFHACDAAKLEISEKLESVMLQLNQTEEKMNAYAEGSRYWHEAWEAICRAMNVDTEGLAGDDESVATATQRAADLHAFNARFYQERNEKDQFIQEVFRLLGMSGGSRDGVLSMIEHNAKQANQQRNQENEWKRLYNELCNAIRIESHSGAIEAARRIREAADMKIHHESAWERQYHALCDAFGIDVDKHETVLKNAREVKANAVRGITQEKYQKKYDELKRAAGLSGETHTDAVRMMSQNPVR